MTTGSDNTDEQAGAEAGAKDDEQGQLETLSFSHHSKWGELVPIILVNLLLNIVTLSIYRFWARTRVRKYLWGKSAINGQPIEYTGKGSELFFGFLIIFFLILLPLYLVIIGVSLLVQAQPLLGAVLMIALYPFLFWLLGVAMFRARRYRLSRSTWRGVRFGQTGKSSAYGLKYMGYMFLNAITLGWATPVRDVSLFRYEMSNTWFGDRRFTFEGQSGPLYPAFAFAWFGSILAYIVAGVFVYFVFGGFFIQVFNANSPADPAQLIPAVLAFYASLIIVALAGALAYAFYFARAFNYLASCSGLEGVKLGFNATGLSLAWLIVGNGLIMVLTLGIGIPFIQARTFHYIWGRLSADGEIDIAAIHQSSLKQPGAGEGLADAFDIGTV